MAWTEESLRAKHVEIARSYVGCDAEKDTERYCDLVAPHGPAESRRFLSTRHEGTPESGCGVVAVGFLRELCRAVGLRVAALEQPMSLDWLEPALDLARENDALVMWAPGRFPRVGCAFHETGPGQHWRTVVGGTPGSGPFDTIDGGAKSGAGFQMIATARPQLRGQIDALNGKSVKFWIDVPRLVFNLLAKVGAGGLPGAAVTITEEVASAVASTVERVKAGSSAPIEGIDVSSIQGAIDWARVAKAGIKFAYCRALIGRDDQDSKLAANMAGARAAGIDAGVYGVVFSRVGKPQDADVQARQLCALHRQHGATLRPMLDVETLPKVTASREEWLAAVELYASTCDAEGLAPTIYTYPAFWAALKAPPRFMKWPLHIAHYTKAAKPTIPAPWSSALLWQYLASAPGFEGRVDGVPGLVDRNRLFGSLDDLRAR